MRGRRLGGVAGHSRGRLVLLLAIALLLSAFLPQLLAYASAQEGYSPPHSKPGPAAEKIRFRAVQVDVAPAEIKDGKIDLYFFSLKTDAARQMRDIPTVRIVEAPATMLSLILNPAPAPEGELNPFSIREVRQAMQYLVDRKQIRDVFFKGLAEPMYTHVTPLDLDYLTLYDYVRELNIHYDPEYARSLITKAMRGAGAELVDGKWMYKGHEVVIRFIIRTEDERRDIGLMVASELEQMGFKVDRQLLEFGPAIDRVYSTDPRTFEWHIYTEGWGRGAVERYDVAGISQFCAPWFGNMPGWREVGFWQYENPEIDEVTQRIFRGEYSGLGERNELYLKATRLCAEDSVRIWLAVVMNSFPVRDELRGLVTDLIAGPRSVYSLREVFTPGRDVVNIGHLWVETPRTTWNPVGGFGDVYSVDIWRYIFDPPVSRHPYSGKPIAFRAGFEVETAGPGGEMDVPSDAFVWDAAAGGWRRVEPGTTARSKVTYDLSRYLGARWHHGEEITWADVLYPIYQAFDISYNPEKSKVETSIAVTTRPFLEVFKGFRIAGDKLEVYVDYWHFEEESIAEFALPTSISMPWEVLAAMDKLVFEKRAAAYSDTAARRFGVRWLNLVKVEDTEGRKLIEALKEMRRRGEVPMSVFTIGGRSYVTGDDAMRRYDAALRWFDEKRHLVISQGPFLLERFDGQAQFAELSAFRDESYPFKPGDWVRRFGEARPVEFEEIVGDRIGIGEEGLFRVKLRGPGELGLRYLLLDPASGRVVESGEATSRGGGVFEIRIPAGKTSGMSPGIYQLYLAAYSPNELGMVFERRVDVEAGRGVTTAQTTPTATATTTTTVEAPQAPPIGSGLIIGIIAVVIAGAAAALMLGRRRRDRPTS